MSNVHSAGAQSKRQLLMAMQMAAPSRLQEAGEPAMAATLERLQSAIVLPAVAARHGQLIQQTEDGALLSFASAAEAVECAMSLQRQLSADQAGLPSGQRVTLRIGIDQAEIADGQESLPGKDFDGEFSLAVRLENSALQGGVCITDPVQRQLGGDTKAAFHYGGGVSPDSLSRPVHVWHWPEAPAAQPYGHAALARTSIAVLAFADHEAVPGQASFADGVSEDILAGLARFHSLSVVAASSSFRFRDRSVPPAEIGQKLAAHYLVEGSIGRSLDHVRLSVRLLEAETGAQIWSQHYDRAANDIFLIEEDAVRMIVSNLPIGAANTDLRQAHRKPPANLSAYEQHLRGLAHLRGNDEGDSRKACAMFEAAIQRDPGFALSHAFLALARVASQGYGTAGRHTLEEGLALSRWAIALDESESGCHRINALMLMYLGDFDGAERAFRRAYSLNSNDANALVEMGGLLARRGKLDEAMQWINEGRRLNPFPPPWYNGVSGNALYLTGRYDEAAAVLSELPKPGVYTLARLAACYAQAGRVAQARTAAEGVLKMRKDFTIGDFLNRAIVGEQPQHRELFRQGLVKAGFPA
jgi:TolB-like protein/class 3 adenylate cyclase